jgi:hypothetical protein
LLHKGFAFLLQLRRFKKFSTRRNKRDEDDEEIHQNIEIFRLPEEEGSRELGRIFREKKSASSEREGDEAALIKGKGD